MKLVTSIELTDEEISDLEILMEILEPFSDLTEIISSADSSLS